jgi:hypothetical protein
MGKRGPQPTTGKGTTIGVRCHADFLDAIDAWRERQEVPPSRAAAIRRLAELGLKSSKPSGRQQPRATIFAGLPRSGLKAIKQKKAKPRR